MEVTLNNTATTENGAPAHYSTLSGLLDFFSRAGSLRGDEAEAIRLFLNAYAEDPVLAKKALFYIRDVRGGQGERKTFRSILKTLAILHPEAIGTELMKLIPFYGRWDDLYSLAGSPLEQQTFSFMKEQFEEDFKIASTLSGTDSTQPISLLAKWLKSENTSSEKSKILGKITRKYFKLSSKSYRKMLTTLRGIIDIVESRMCSKDWNGIEYPHVPSYAMKNYTKAFIRHDGKRFNAFTKAALNGDVKINASTLYPYDIVRKYTSQGECVSTLSEEENIVNEALWRNLPNYFKDGEYNTMVVVDVSGSMYSCKGSSIRPIDVALSLGLYMAERNSGPLKNIFMTFSRNPQLVTVKGSSLNEKLLNMSRADWGQNTDILAVFKKFIDAVKIFKVPRNQVPKKLFIISDMQFDKATGGCAKCYGCGDNGECDYDIPETTYQTIKRRFNDEHIEMPSLVFWNVNGSRGTTPVTKGESGTFLVSGASPSILSHALNTETTNPFDFMLEVLNSDRYKGVV
jgi:hypothetical protein